MERKSRNEEVTEFCDNNVIMIVIGAPAQDLPKFQMLCLTPKSVQTCLIYSPDGDRKVSLKKNDPFMTNGCHIVAPPDVTSD